MSNFRFVAWIIFLIAWAVAGFGMVGILIFSLLFPVADFVMVVAIIGLIVFFCSGNMILRYLDKMKS